MPTTTTNYGWTNPASGDAQAASELAISATIDAIDGDLGDVAAGLGTIPGSGWHVAATLAALLDDLYSRYYVLATTTPTDVVIGGDTVVVGGYSVIARL